MTLKKYLGNDLACICQIIILLIIILLLLIIIGVKLFVIL